MTNAKAPGSYIANFFSADKSHAPLLVLNFTCGEKNNKIYLKTPVFKLEK